MKWLIYIFFILIFSLMYFSKVDNSLTREDNIYINKILGYQELQKTKNYEDEIKQIKMVQNKVFSRIPHNLEGIPFFQTREVKDYFYSNVALCFDRSRTIEKILQYLGYETRHVSIYSIKGSGSALFALLTPGIDSHALTEVKTQKGWMIVDSVNLDVYDYNNEPISIQALKNKDLNIDTYITKSFKKEFIYIYGLYSRHGKFFPPYNFIPDIEYNEFLDNMPIISR